MKSRDWRRLGAGFVLCGLFAVAVAIIETALFDQPNDGIIPGLSDYLYALGIHLLIALFAALGVAAVSSALRPLGRQISDRNYPLISLGVFLALELGVAGAYWAGTSEIVPRFHTQAGKLATAGLAAAGVIVGIVLGFVIARAFPRERWANAARGRLGSVGLVSAALLIGIAAITLISMRPRREGAAAHAGAPPADRANVIIVLSDTLRRDHLSYFGYPRPTSSAIDGLFGQSYVFTNAYTPSNWTIPSVASLFTGLYPSTHGVISALQCIPPDAQTLAEHFRDNGYRTAAFVGNPIITGQNGFAQGFDEYFPPDPPWWTYHNRTAVERIATQLRRPGTQGLAWRISDEALAWLERNSAEPCFVYVHFMEPHSPYRPTAENRRQVAPDAPPGPQDPPRLYDQPGMSRQSGFSFNETSAGSGDCHDWECLADPPRLSDADLAGMIANYDGVIHGLDRTIAFFLRDLGKMGLLDNSHVIFCSDHGEEFFDHRGWYHGNSIYEETTACPLAYRPPGGLADGARVIARPVSLLDIVPTVCERLGIDTPPLEQGHVIPEVLGQDPGNADAPVLVENPRHLYALRLRQWKLIRRGAENEPIWRLYDLSSDPHETHDLSAALPETLAVMRGQMLGLVAQHEQRAMPGAERTSDPELLQRLKALGYVR